MMVAQTPSPLRSPAAFVTVEARLQAEQAEAEMERTVQELAATYRELAMAYGVLEAISTPNSREGIAGAVLAHLCGALQASGGGVFSLGRPGLPAPVAVVGMSGSAVQALQAGLQAQLKTKEHSELPFAFGLGSKEVLAATVETEATETLAVAVWRPSVFTSREAKLLRASVRQAALAMRNRSLVDEVRALFMSTIEALVAAIEAKDPYTCGHSRRVAHWVLATARRLGLSEEEVEDLQTAAIVHDVGKIGVDTAVLRKAGPLETQEWAEVRTHPDRGAAIIACVPRLKHLTPAIRHHHERYDGQGYPARLQGAQIPLGASLIAICDSYDAMTSARPYRAALPAEVARQELVACSGAQFDREVVAAFLEACAT